ncbi:MAG: LamG domain-containing protein [Myxococcota bacterium]
MDRWRRRMPGIIAVLGVASCQPPQFRCNDDRQCTSDQGMGRCEPQGYCSFPREDCTSGWAFEAYAADGLAGQCVLEAGNSSSTSTESPMPSIPSTSGVASTPGADSGESTAGDPGDPWFDCSFSTRYRLKLSGVRGGTQLGEFELLVTLTPDRVDLDELGLVGSALCFVTRDGMPLAWEVDSVEPEQVLVWVTVGSLARGEVFYLYTGGDTKACAAPPIWANNDYVGVYHLGEPVVDGSAAGNDPKVVSSTLVPGFIGDAREYDDDSDQVLLPPSPSLTGIFAGGGTIIAWVQPAVDTGERRIVERADSGQGRNGFIFLVHETRLELRRGGEGDNGRWGSDADLEIGTWHHVAVVFDDDDPDAGASFWLDGVATGSMEFAPLVGGVEIDPTLETRLGRAPPELGNLEGRLDEVRLSTVARSGEWIEHQVLSDVDALLDYGPAEASTCSGEG